MCGIAGILTKQNYYPPGGLEQVVEGFNVQLSHRGPDAQGAWYFRTLGLSHRRLSIIDLSPQGNQPMVSSSDNLVVCYNGEIYNFGEIKSELIAKGYTFHSASDTEVILYAYQEWGCASFSRYNGMFAFALVDKQKQELILARDHSGIKPLYYHVGDDKLIFGSEMRVFKQHNPSWPVNPNWEYHFLSFGFIPFPHTTLRDVFMLPKGTYLKISLNTFSDYSTKKTFRENIKPLPFHTFSFSHTIRNEAEALEAIRSTMIAAVDRHMISDAPLGIFLSGGVDSSLLALIADYRKHQSLNTVSVTFDEATFNEKPYQDMVLKAMRPHTHKEYRVNSAMFMDSLPDIFAAMDQPTWDGVNSYFVSRCAREAGLKVVLSGLGSDELFGGYPSFQRIDLLNRLRVVPGSVKTIVSYFGEQMKRLSFLNLPTNYNEYLFLRGGFDPGMISKLTGRHPQEVIEAFSLLKAEGMPVKRDQNMISYLETNIYMESQLLKDTDFMSMWHSLEVRVPFLDKELMELVFKIDPAVKFNQAQPKYLITKAFEDLLPREVVFRKKQGFTFPFELWLKSNMAFFRPMLPDTPVTQELVNRFMEGKVHWSRIWALVVWGRFRK